VSSQRARVAWRILLAAAWLSSCSKFEEGPTAAPDGGAGDAGVPDSGSSGNGDATPDGAPGEGGCSKHQFCQTFEDGEPKNEWLASSNTKVVQDAFVSPSSSLELKLQANDFPGPVLTLSPSSAAAITHIQCGMQLRIDERGAKRGAVILAFSTADKQVGLELQPGGDAKVTAPGTATDVTTPTFGMFTAVGVELEVGASEIHAKVTVSGSTQNVTLSTKLSPISAITFGLAANGVEADMWRAHIDDAWCDILK